MKTPKSDGEYVIYYAEKLKGDRALFKQQKILIESQLQSSQSFFKNLFGEDNFKENARIYLKKVGIINSE